MRLHCTEHGYMDEKTGPMAECPYCEIDRLNAKYKQLYLAANWLSVIIGVAGSVDSDHGGVSALMDALYDIDGGTPIK